MKSHISALIRKMMTKTMLTLEVDL